MKLYIETSVPNFLFVTDAPDKRAVTEQFFDEVRVGLHQACVSALYAQEVARTPNPLLRYQLEIVQLSYNVQVSWNFQHIVRAWTMKRFQRSIIDSV